MLPTIPYFRIHILPECIYIATRLSSKQTGAKGATEYLYNVRQSYKAGAEVWRKGHYPFIPALDKDLYLELDGDYGLGGMSPYGAGLEWVRRCDSILIYNGLEDSNGVQNELKEAQDLNKKIYYSLEEISSVSNSVVNN